MLTDMKKILLILLVSVTATSCVSLKKVRYIQDTEINPQFGTKEYPNESLDTYRIHPGDHLYIDIKSLDSKNTNPFQSSQTTGYQMSSEASIYLNSYMVNDSGYIDFPVVGRVYVRDHTMEEVKTKLQKTVDEYFQFTSVSVKLVNFKISLLGEITRPGTYPIYQNNINIFQAISLGGDLTTFANRAKVKVIRKTESGSSVHELSLLKSDILTSEAYYLKPDDIVYFEPIGGRNFTFKEFPYAIIFSTISTTLLIINFFIVNKK